MENPVALYIYRRFLVNHQVQFKFWHNKNQPSADFVLEFGERRIAIELGWGNKSARQIKATMNKVKCHYGLVIAGSKLALNSKKQIVNLPTDQFLLT